MTDVVKMPREGLFDKDGKLTKAGHFYLTGIERVVEQLRPLIDQVSSVGAGLGDLSSLDEVSRSELATGFGIIPLQQSEVAATTAQAASAGTIPYDDSIPQVSEGTEVLTGTFTPLSGASQLEIRVELQVSSDSTAEVTAALFVDGGADAVAAAAIDVRTAAAAVRLNFTHWMASPGTAAITLAVRAGGNSGNTYVNGVSTGRIGGGSLRSFIRVSEFLAV